MHGGIAALASAYDKVQESCYSCFACCASTDDAVNRSTIHEVNILHLKLRLNLRLLVMHIADMPCQINPVSGLMSTTSCFRG